MKAQFEKIRSTSNSFVLFERKEPSLPFLWHYHPECELTLIIDSRGQRFVGDAVANYSSGDLVLLGPNLPHTWRSEPASAGIKRMHRAIVAQFHPDFLAKQFLSVPEMSSVAQLIKRASCGLAFNRTKTGSDTANRMRRMVSLSPPRQLMALLSILIDLAAESGAERLSTGSVKPAYALEHQHRIEMVCDYLKSQFADEIDYPRLAHEVHMKLASLCRSFKRATGRTMTAYVNELRVSSAARLLQETELSVLEVGLRSGFKNYSNFNRQFKKLKGFGPRTLRREFQPAATRAASR